MVDDIQQFNLIEIAKKSMENAYAPYSKFKVGAAIKSKNGNVYNGCNIEIASSTPSCCAERVAIFKAVSKGEKKFINMAIVGDTYSPISPCGVCRQVMNEFFDQNTEIYLVNLKHVIKVTNINDLLPYPFNSKRQN